MVSREVDQPELDAFTDVAMLNGRFIAATSRSGFWFSMDGVTWRLDEMAPRNLGSTTIHRALGGLVIVGQTGEGPGTAIQIWRSGDGVAWRRVADRPLFHDFCGYGFAGSAKRIVMLGTTCSTGKVAVLVSGDGRSWRRATPLGISPGLITYVGGRFVVSSAFRYRSLDGLGFWISSDGITWFLRSFMRTQVSAGYLTETDAIYDIVRVGDLFVAVGGWSLDDGRTGALAWRSPDLRQWRREPIPNGDGNLFEVQAMHQAVVVDGRVIAVGTADLAPDGQQAKVWIGTP